MRCFTAIELTQTWRETLFRACAPLRTRCPRLRWVAPDNLHLTLEFLGEVGDHDVATIAQRYEDVAKTQTAFDLALTAPGAFPNFARPRVFWWGAADPAGGVAAWSAAARGMLAEVGIALEGRPVAPHITLARVRSPFDARGLSEALAEVQPPRIAAFSVREMTLFESRLGRMGAIYVPIARFPLNAGQPE